MSERRFSPTAISSSTMIYHTKANQQTMMETFRTGCYMDTYGRLNIVSSTQIVYHVRRIISHALGIPKSRIRVQKPRIGGGFGAKQSAVCEVYPAFVTYKTGKPCKIDLQSCRESDHLFAPPRDGGACPPRRDEERTHPTRWISTPSRTPALTASTARQRLACPATSPSRCTRRTSKPGASAYDVVYTNVMSAGAYRGYGATQGIFAVESAM